MRRAIGRFLFAVVLATLVALPVACSGERVAEVTAVVLAKSSYGDSVRVSLGGDRAVIASDDQAEQIIVGRVYRFSWVIAHSGCWGGPDWDTLEFKEVVP